MSASPTPPRPGVIAGRALALARDVLATEARAIDALAGRLGSSFVDAVDRLFHCRGRVVVSPPAEFDAWLEQQKAAATPVAAAVTE